MRAQRARMWTCGAVAEMVNGSVWAASVLRLYVFGEGDVASGSLPDCATVLGRVRWVVVSRTVR